MHSQTNTNTWDADKHTHRLLLCEQLFILLSVTSELLCELHLAVYGLSQVLGQDVPTSLMETTVAADETQPWRHKLLFHINPLEAQWLGEYSHWVQFLHLHQLAAQTSDFLLQLWHLSMDSRDTPERTPLLELILRLCLLQLRLQLIHLPPNKNITADEAATMIIYTIILNWSVYKRIFIHKFTKIDRTQALAFGKCKVDFIMYHSNNKNTAHNTKLNFFHDFMLSCLHFFKNITLYCMLFVNIFYLQIK